MIAITQSYISCPLYMTYFENDVILEGRVADFMKRVKKVNLTKIENKLNKMKQELVKVGVDVKEIFQSIEDNGKEAVQGIKAGDKNAVSRALEDIFNEMKGIITKQQLNTASILMMCIIIINTLMLFVIKSSLPLLGLPASLALPLVGIFVAPLVEEFAKFFSIKKKMTGYFFARFNMIEFAHYVWMLCMGGMSFPAAVGHRSLTVLMHATTTLVQKILQDKGQSKKGLKAGILIHSLWNMISILSPLLKKLLHNPYL